MPSEGCPPASRFWRPPFPLLRSRSRPQRGHGLVQRRVPAVVQLQGCVGRPHQVIGTAYKREPIARARDRA